MLGSMKSALVLALALIPSLGLAQGVRSFTDEDYRSVLRSQSRVLFYSFSPSMPLSVEGLKEIGLAAESLRATLVPLADPAAREADILSLRDSRIRYQKSGILRDRGLQLHYPSVMVANDHKLLGTPIRGFKTRTGYVTLVSDMLHLPWKEEFQVTGDATPPLSMTAFFKSVYGTDVIASGSTRASNYLFHLKTNAVYMIESHYGDPGPTPDGQFLTLLNAAGLTWFSIPEILAGRVKPGLWDPGLRTYQSVGQLSPSRYRVIGALSSSTDPAGLIVREYQVAETESQGRTVVPVEEWRSVCSGKTISIPMLSKTGQLLSGSYQGTLRVFRIGANATECDQVFDTKAVSGKADISRDDNALTYVTRAVNPSTGESVDTVFLADLRAMTTKPVFYGDPKAQLAFPGFASADRIVVYDQVSRKLLILDRTRTIQ